MVAAFNLSDIIPLWMGGITKELWLFNYGTRSSWDNQEYGTTILWALLYYYYYKTSCIISTKPSAVAVQEAI